MDKFVFNASVFEGAPLYASTIATQVTVIDKATDTLATIWSDREGLILKSNPFTLDEAGVIEFYADEGRYDISAANGPNVSVWKDEILGAAGGGGGAVDSVSGGDGVNVDNSDPANPVVFSNFATNNQAASYTLSDADTNRWTDLTGSAVIDIECPPESSVDLGSKFVHLISNYSTGVVTITAGAGVTVNPPAGGTLIVPQFATVGIKKSNNSADDYIVFGATQAI